VDSTDDLLDRAQAKLGVRFADPQLLLTALTHSSYVKSQGAPVSASNERLEFLGDAVLGLVIAEYFFREYPDRAEGDLTRLKSVIVSEATLARCARERGLGELLVLDRGEEESGGRDRPSILADAFEAVIGAVFLDQGLPAAADFIFRWLQPALEENGEGLLEGNFKGVLQELTQNIGRETPRYVVTQASGPEHDKTFVVQVYFQGRLLGTGAGKTKKAAEQRAAEEAVAALAAELEPDDSPIA
jgi:ribonuclease-3